MKNAIRVKNDRKYNMKISIKTRLGKERADEFYKLIEIYNNKVTETEKIKYGNEVCSKYLNGDINAEESVNEWINNIVTELMAITVFYNPEIICLGGGISEEDWFIEKVKKKFIIIKQKDKLSNESYIQLSVTEQSG